MLKGEIKGAIDNCFSHFFSPGRGGNEFSLHLIFFVFTPSPLLYNPFSSLPLPLLNDLCLVSHSVGLLISLRVMYKEKGQKIGLLSLGNSMEFVF